MTLNPLDSSNEYHDLSWDSWQCIHMAEKTPDEAKKEYITKITEIKEDLWQYSWHIIKIQMQESWCCMDFRALGIRLFAFYKHVLSIRWILIVHTSAAIFDVCWDLNWFVSLSEAYSQGKLSCISYHIYLSTHVSCLGFCICMPAWT